MCFTDFDGPSVFRASRHRARKPHKCTECGRTIEPGERYQIAWGVWNGQPETFRTCRECLRDRGRIVARELADGCARHEAFPPFGGLHEVLHNYGLKPTRHVSRKVAT